MSKTHEAAGTAQPAETDPHSPRPGIDRHAPRRPVDLDKAIGERLRALREARGLTQAALAARCGLSFQQIQKYERGINRISASRLYAFAAALGVDVATFLGGMADGAPAGQDRTRLAARLDTAVADLDLETLRHITEIAERLSSLARAS